MVEKCLISKGIEVVAASEDITATNPCMARECVCIDFTTPAAFRANYRFLAENFKAVVVGTTGWDDIRDEVISAFEECGTTMVYASNFSIGVNVFFALADQASRMLASAGYSTFIEERHHCHKLDRPSGTAKSIASIVEANTGIAPEVASIRCGEIAGIHTLDFEGGADRITLTHEAFSREGFAAGAVEAALRIESLTGVHEFKDIIFNK